MLSAARPDPYPLPGLAGSSSVTSTAALHNSEYLLLLVSKCQQHRHASPESLTSLQHW